MKKPVYVTPEFCISEICLSEQLLEESNTESLIGGDDPDIVW